MIPIFKPYMPTGITAELEQILYSGNLAFGTNGRLFENSLKSYLDCEYVLTISSYNHAQLIVLSTLGLQPGDEVIASPVSCLASNQPFAIKGLKIIWADVEPSTGAMDVEDVKSKITKNTKAIFHNHYCGYLGYINEINALGKENGITVIDDCIEAFGSVYNDSKIGNVGTDISVFSFQTVRLPNTIEGGAIVFKNKELFEKAKLIRDYGIDRSIFRDELNEINKDCDIKLEGYGALMSEINSFIGLKQIDQVDELILKQRKNAESWDSAIGDLEWINPLKKTQKTTPNNWIYGAIVSKKYKAIQRLRDSGFYATGVHINNNIYSVFNDKKELKGVNEFIDHFVALPCGWWLEWNQIIM